jgi:hypothetical protein
LRKAGGVHKRRKGKVWRATREMIHSERGEKNFPGQNMRQQWGKCKRGAKDSTRGRLAYTALD